MFDLIERPSKTKEQLENEAYLNSPEWKELLEQGSKAVNYDYTFIYRDTDGSLREDWHFMSDINMDYVKGKYAKQKKEIIKIVLKELPFGEYLKSIYGSSK
jgi:hypothetical protein